MVYTEPNSVCYLTPIDTKSLSPNEFFSAKEDDRFGFRLTSNLFDERYSVISKGFFPEYSPVTSEHTFKRELDGYSLKNVFSSEYHASIGYIVALNAGNTPYSDYPYGDLSNNVVENSLNPDILQAFNDIKALSGKSLKSEFINAVAKLLIRDELKYFNRSKVIMIEKPLSTPDMEGCQELFKLSKQKGVFVTCSFNHTLTPNTNMASDLISDGLIKNGKSIHVRWLEHWGGIFDAHPWLDGPQDSYLGFSDRGGGACGEHSHGISIWQHFSHLLNQGKISEVTSTMKIVNDTYDETTQILVKSENGIIGTIIQDVVTNPPVKKARIQGEDGYLEWIVNYSDSEDALMWTGDHGRPRCTPFFKSRPDDFKWEIEHIEDILDNKTDRDSSPISLERGLDVMLVIAAAHLSNETGKKVKIDYKKGYSLEALNVI